MTTYLDVQLAWATVEHCRPSMRRRDLNIVFVALGAGDYYTAIAASIAAMNHAQNSLPEELRDGLTAWADLMVDPACRNRIDDLIACASVTPAPIPPPRCEVPLDRPPDRPRRMR